MGSARGRAPATSRAAARLTATGVTTSEGLRGGVRAQASLSSLAFADLTRVRSVKARAQFKVVSCGSVVLSFVE